MLAIRPMTSRAVSVTHELLKRATIDAERILVTGHADTRPRASNDTPEDRAKNRRVDVSIVRGGEIDELRSMSILEAAARSPFPDATATDNEVPTP